MSRTPTLTVVETPPYQPLANAAFDILQKAHDALAFLEIEANDKYYNESEAIDKTSNVEFTIAEDKYDDWREKRNVRIINNARMEGLHDAIKEAVQKLTSALGGVEYYR